MAAAAAAAATQLVADRADFAGVLDNICRLTVLQRDTLIVDGYDKTSFEYLSKR